MFTKNIIDTGGWSRVIGSHKPSCLGHQSSLHLLCHYDTLTRSRFEIFQVGNTTPEEIREAALGEILSFAGRIILILERGWYIRPQRANWSLGAWTVTRHDP